jgi:hypothetical protein
MIRTAMGRPPDEFLRGPRSARTVPACIKRSKALRFRCLRGPRLAAFRPEAKVVFHPDTQFLIDHWTGLARSADVRGGIPARSAVNPEALGRRLPRVFVADWRDGQAILRLAGTGLEAFYRRPLAGQPLNALWQPASGDMVSTAVGQAVREARPVVVVGLAPGDPAVPVEMVVAPLRAPTSRPHQILGLFAPAAALAPTGNGPVLLTARLAVSAGQAGRPALSLAAVEGRRIA